MKTLSIRIIAFLFVAALVTASCKKDDPAPAALGLTLATLEGDWAVSSGEGTEWQEGVGIITPRAVDGSLVGLKFRFEDNVLTVYDVSGAVVFGPITFTLNESTKVISVGDNAVTGLGVYTINNFVAGATMEWDQREPIAADYEPQAGCGCNLSFQKFLKFVRM